MRKLLTMLFAVVLLVVAFGMPAMAGEVFLKFKGGIGVIPVSRAAGTQNADGTFPNVVRNDVRGVPPGGQPWVIESLKADVTVDGRIRVDGRGLLLAGGNVGTNGGQSVRAVLFCGPATNFTAHRTDPPVALEADGDFRIDDALDNLPLPNPCEDPVLLIVSANGNWFGAGIPQ